MRRRRGSRTSRGTRDRYCGCDSACSTLEPFAFGMDGVLGGAARPRQVVCAGPCRGSRGSMIPLKEAVGGLHPSTLAALEEHKDPDALRFGCKQAGCLGCKRTRKVEGCILSPSAESVLSPSTTLRMNSVEGLGINSVEGRCRKTPPGPRPLLHSSKRGRPPAMSPPEIGVVAYTIKTESSWDVRVIRRASTEPDGDSAQDGLVRRTAAVWEQTEGDHLLIASQAHPRESGTSLSGDRFESLNLPTRSGGFTQVERVKPAQRMGAFEHAPLFRLQDVVERQGRVDPAAVWRQRQATLVEPDTLYAIHELQALQDFRHGRFEPGTVLCGMSDHELEHGRLSGENPHPQPPLFLLRHGDFRLEPRGARHRPR